MQDAHEDPQHVAPGLVKAYNMLLRQQHLLFDLQPGALRTAQRHDFIQFEAASMQFAQEVRPVISYSVMMAQRLLRLSPSF